MKYQLVFQWDSSSLADYDKLIEIENAMIQGLDGDHDVDGHDEGSGQMNIFIQTDDPKNAFGQSRAILSNCDAWKGVRIAYRQVSGNSYTILWPKGLAEFKVI
jgi:hypothetical protein